jgi:hypothetical protein
MSKAHLEDWLTLGGLLLLAVGTGAQAWVAAADFRRVIDSLTGDARKKVQSIKPYSGWIGMAGIGADGIVIGLAKGWIILVGTAIMEAPRKMAKIRQDGGPEAVELALLVRTSVAWIVLMLGSILVFAGEVVHIRLLA